MLRLVGIFAGIGVAVPILFLTVPCLYRLFSSWPELIVTIWPTSMMLLADRGLPASILSVVSNAVVYAAAGICISLLFGRSAPRYVRIRNERDAEAIKKIQWSSIRTLSLALLLLLPVTLVAFLNESVLVQVVQLVATVLAALRIRSHAVYPLGRLFTRSGMNHAVDDLLFRDLRSLEATKSIGLFPLTSIWLALLAVLIILGPAERAMLPAADLGWVAPVAWTAVAVALALATTAAFLWLSFHVMALRRGRSREGPQGSPDDRHA